tara:strand:+ start:314 stop:1303 length:990 start_codon:yes stop_codon:yes gene_type:complete
MTTQNFVTLPREVVEDALRAISAAVFGTDTYKVSSRGDFVSRVEKKLRAALTEQVQPANKLWLWKNFVNGQPEYWAFDNPYPIGLDHGDPQTLGEPCGYALVKQSRNGRPDVQYKFGLKAVEQVQPAQGISVAAFDRQFAASEAMAARIMELEANTAWVQLSEPELEAICAHWKSNALQACLDVQAILKHKNAQPKGEQVQLANPCKLTECQGKPRCGTCAVIAGQVQPAQGELETLLEKYWEIAYTEGHTGVSQGKEANNILHKLRALLQSNAERVPLTPEQEDAMCEAHINADSDAYFKARPALDFPEMRRIFYAGHRKAWITKGQQ